MTFAGGNLKHSGKSLASVVRRPVGLHMRLVPLTHSDLCHRVWHRAPFSGDGWIFELKRWTVFAHSPDRVRGFKCLRVGDCR